VRAYAPVARGSSSPWTRIRSKCPAVCRCTFACLSACSCMHGHCINVQLTWKRASFKDFPCKGLNETPAVHRGKIVYHHLQGRQRLLVIRLRAGCAIARAYSGTFAPRIVPAMHGSLCRQSETYLVHISFYTFSIMISPERICSMTSRG